MFIKKLDFTVDLAQVNLDLDEILTKTTWEPGNQIGLTHRKNTDRDLWKDSMGGNMNRVTKERYFFEEDFSEFNSAVPSYTRSVIEKFAESQNFIPGRVRFMRLIPNTGLSLHNDETVRYHLAINTNSAVPSYTRSVIEKFAKSQNFIPGRVRFMRLIPNTGLSLHDDETVRYHLAINTNSAAYVAKGSFTVPTAACFHIPADGHFYLMDTRLPHFVYNAGMTDRVHLVICPINIENKE